MNELSQRQYLVNDFI